MFNWLHYLVGKMSIGISAALIATANFINPTPVLDIAKPQQESIQHINQEVDKVSSTTLIKETPKREETVPVNYNITDKKNDSPTALNTFKEKKRVKNVIQQPKVNQDNKKETLPSNEETQVIKLEEPKIISNEKAPIIPVVSVPSTQGTENLSKIKDDYNELLKKEINEYNQWITWWLAQRQRDLDASEQMRQQAHTNCVNRHINTLESQISNLQAKKKSEVDKLTATLLSGGGSTSNARLQYVEQVASDYDRQIQQLESEKSTSEGFCYLAETSNSSYTPSFNLNDYERERQEREVGWKRIMLDHSALNNGITIKRDMNNRVTDIISKDGFGFTFTY